MVSAGDLSLCLDAKCSRSCLQLKAIFLLIPFQCLGDSWQCAMQAEQSDKATLQQQLREAQSVAAQAAAAAPVAAQQQQQLAEQTAAVARLQQQLTEAQVTGMQEHQSTDNFAAAHMQFEAASIAGHCHVGSDRIRVFTGKGPAPGRQTICLHLVLLLELSNVQSMAWQADSSVWADRQHLTELSLSSALAAVTSLLRCARHAAACPDAACAVANRCGLGTTADLEPMPAKHQASLCRPCCRAHRGQPSAPYDRQFVLLHLLLQSLLRLCPSVLLLPSRPRCRALRASWRLSASRSGSGLLASSACSARKGSGSAWRSR